MNRDRWLLLVSILLLAGTAVYHVRPEWVTFGPGKRMAAVVAKPSSSLPTPSPGAASPALPPVSVQSEAVDEHTPWGRNPFLTAEEETGKGKSQGGDGLQVKAIIVGRPKSVATIDGRTVTVGEKVGEEIVSEIRPDAVVLERDGRKRMIKVSEPAVSVQVQERKK
ncbi:MAG: hypothetical protein HYY46_25255 [Deltaproteobacteria bacterium]|nr:hypothetical protein [Deltaproteobacteria bacterium]